MNRPRSFLTVLLLSAALIGAAGEDTRLLDAVKAGDRGAVGRILQQHVDVNAAERDGTTALHWAAHRNDLEVVDLLIRAGANVRAVNRYGVAPLTVACESASADLVERLLAAGADPNEAAADGETALMTAARTGDPGVIRALIARGAVVNAHESRKGQTALMWAATENNIAAVDALLQAAADVHLHSRGGFSPLLFAVRAGHRDVVVPLLKAGASANETLPDGTSALTLAITNAHWELAASLLDAGADPNADAPGWTPLHQLLWTRRPKAGLAEPPPVPTGRISSAALAKRLLARGANPNARIKKDRSLGFDDRHLLDRIGATPFLVAAEGADVEMMGLLAAGGADPLLTTADHTTALMAAAGVGIWVVGESPGTNEEALEAVKAALELGGGVRAVNDYGYTALHGAAHRGAPQIVQPLVDKGAKPNARLTKTGGGPLGWKEGWTPLAIADGVFYANTFKRSPETADLLRRLT